MIAPVDASLLRDRRGVTAIEFAICGPVFLMLLFGIYDVGHSVYLRSVLNGAVEQVSRTDTLETADPVQADAYVRDLVQTVVPGAQVTANRQSYYDFADIRRPESWNDKNGNGLCDNSEGFIDENRNGRWDADIGNSDNGGAGDVVLYTVTVSYQPIFTNPFVSGSSAQRTLTATAVKKNQPYALQQSYGSKAGVCQ